jgi:hypothetical protein
MMTKLRKLILVNEFKWEENNAMKISCFGPRNIGPNVLVNKSVLSVLIQYFEDVEDYLGVTSSVLLRMEFWPENL